MDKEEEVKTMEYWSIVGKLMYYMKKIGPELANAVQELARQMVKSNKEHWKALEQVVGYVINEPYQKVTYHCVLIVDILHMLCPGCSIWLGCGWLCLGSVGILCIWLDILLQV